MSPPRYADSVFINCPFDPTYQKLFRAIVFAVFDCGYTARCALEIDDGGDVRIDKIYRIIRQSKYGIHDISRTEPDPTTHLPRFNMPFELGMFLGAKKFGDIKQKSKGCLILDRKDYRYQKFISDIAGQDIKAHLNKPDKAIGVVRDWLSNASKRRTIPGGVEIYRRYTEFRGELPRRCRDLKIEEDEMTFNDYTNFVEVWLKVNG